MKRNNMDREIIEIGALNVSFRTRAEGIDVSCDLLNIHGAPNKLITKLSEAIHHTRYQYQFLIRCQGEEIPFCGYIKGFSFEPSPVY